MTFDFAFYWNLFLRRLPVMLALVLILGGLGAAVAMRLPPEYTASSRLLVESPQIPEGMASSTVRAGAAEQLQVIQQRLTTRANLIDIANRFRIFSDDPSTSPDEVVRRMRESTSIQWTGTRGRDTDRAIIVTITFRAPSGRIAADVVNDYVTRILAENADFRMSRVEGTLEFFEQEVERLSADIDRQNARIVEFNAVNSGALPEGQSYRLNRQSLLQERQSRLERDQSNLEEQRAQVVAIFEATGRVNAAQDRQAPLSPDEQRLQRLQQELSTALTIYSESNPRVRLLRSQVAQLEATVARASANTERDGPSGDPNRALFEITLADIDTRLEDVRSELEATETELGELEVAISASASNALELASLQRDLEAVQAQHANAVRNLNAARLGERIEVSAQGERISVIETATIPNTPSGPNRTRIAAMGLAAGVGLAGAFFVLLEILNRTIRRPTELRSRFGITPIATIPYMESAARKWLRRSSLIAATLVAVVGVPLSLWWIDSNYMPLQVIVARSLDQLGLG